MSSVTVVLVEFRVLEIMRAIESNPNIDHCTESQSPHLLKTNFCSFGGTLEAQTYLF